MALTVEELAERLKYETDDVALQYLASYLAAASMLVEKLVGGKFDADNDQIKLAITMFCEFFIDPETNNEKVLNGDYLPLPIRVVLSGLYVPLVV